MVETMETNVAKLREMEQELNTVSQQKQNSQIQLVEVENSLKELEGSKEKAYKVVGPVILEVDSSTLAKDLKEKKEVLSFRVGNMEKKEKELKETFQKLQEEVMKQLQEKK